VVEVQDDAANTWFEAFVDAATGELVSVTDFVAQATYRVLPIWKEYPTDGLETLVNPEDKVASPYGWLSTDGVNFNNFTAGNNAIAAIWADTAPATAADEFVYPYAVGEDVSTASQKRAAIVNAFYVVNTVHDISYRYGFTEATFNFQKTNIAHAGMGNDRVVISVQDSVGVDNAYFSTPADGSAGRMVMFMWDYFTPLRDGSLENDIVAHEMTHGITNR
jgi:extracellular elastinolytic metalloproteinase